MARLRRFVALPLLAAAVVLAQGVRETVQVGLVTIRIDARDSKGEPIPDLTASDVKLRVDGKDVVIEGLDRIAVSPAAAPPRSAPAPAATTGAAPPVPAASASFASSDLYLAILVDETTSNSFDRREVYKQLDSFLGKGAGGVHVMLQRFDGRLRTECPWTTDLAQAVAAAKKMGKRLQDAQLPSPSDLRGEIFNGRKPRDVQQQVEHFSRRTFDAILQALVRFPEVPGRRGLVVITDGTPFISPFDLTMLFSDTDAAARDKRSMHADELKNKGDPDEKSGSVQIEHILAQEALATFSDSGPGQNVSWAKQMAQITNKATELDIAFYPVDSESPDRGTNPDVGSKWPGRSMPGVVVGGSSAPVAGSGMTARIPVVQAMATLADMTGGQAMLVPRNLADGLSGVATARTKEYVVSFRDPFPGDNRYHKVEISIARPGARVAYRRGYRVRSEEQRIVDTIVAHLAEPPAGGNPLGLRASLDVVRQEGGRNIVEMRLEYTPAEAPGDSGAERNLDVYAVCTDEAGNRAAPIHRKARAKRVTGSAAASYVDAFQLALPSGPYTWSVAITDVPTGVTSYAVIKKTI